MTSQRFVGIPTSVILKGDNSPRDIAQPHKHDTSRVIVLPAQGIVIAFVPDGAITFTCTPPDASQELAVIEVLVGLGFYIHSLDVPAHIVNPNARSNEQYILEKPIIGKGVAE